MRLKLKNCNCKDVEREKFLCDACFNEIMNDMIGKDKMDVIKCDGCYQYVRRESVNSNYPDSGSEIHLDGGYGMFHDSGRMTAILCHDCTIAIVRMIRSFSESDNISHSVSVKSQAYPLCCEYSWTFDDDHKVVRGSKFHFVPGLIYEENR